MLPYDKKCLRILNNKKVCAEYKLDNRRAGEMIRQLKALANQSSVSRTHIA